jgi:hypothetical protein
MIPHLFIPVALWPQPQGELGKQMDKRYQKAGLLCRSKSVPGLQRACE